MRGAGRVAGGHGDGLTSSEAATNTPGWPPLNFGFQDFSSKEATLTIRIAMVEIGSGQGLLSGAVGEVGVECLVDDERGLLSTNNCPLTPFTFCGLPSSSAPAGSL